MLVLLFIFEILGGIGHDSHNFKSIAFIRTLNTTALNTEGFTVPIVAESIRFHLYLRRPSRCLNGTIFSWLGRAENEPELMELGPTG
jgi:hypothetical protein